MYFATYVNGDPNSYLKNGIGYANLPLLTPVNPMTLGANPLELAMEIGEEKSPAQVALVLYAQAGESSAITARLNGTSLDFVQRTSDGLLVYSAPLQAVKPGKNVLRLGVAEQQNKAELLDAALFFYRVKDDPEMADLASLCFR